MSEEPLKYFTLAEAQQLLPELKRRIERLRGLRRSLEGMAPEIAKLSERARENSGNPVGTRYALDLMRFQEELQAFADTGCILRDLDRGLLDFPALRGQRKIFLCWVWGEESIGWWHDMQTGFAGRQPLDD